MQIKSSDGAMTVDYQQVKDFLGDIKKNVRLRVLTFVTETVNRKLIHVNDMADELFDRLDNYKYEVTINTRRPAQYMPDTELAQFSDTILVRQTRMAILQKDFKMSTLHHEEILETIFEGIQLDFPTYQKMSRLKKLMNYSRSQHNEKRIMY